MEDNQLVNDELNPTSVDGEVGATQEGEQGQETDWEESAKYFQSQKDKLASENEQLKKYEKIGKLIEERPDIQKALVNAVSDSSNQDSRVQITQDEFDPWEAYHNPQSKSYKFRMQEIDNIVNDRISNQMEGVQRGVAMNQLKADLVSKGLNDNEVEDFIKFAGTPANELGVDNVVKMWRAMKESPVQEHNPLDQVRENQQTPQSGGVLQGERPKVKSDIDSMWDGIVSAGGRSNILK